MTPGWEALVRVAITLVLWAPFIVFWPNGSHDWLSVLIVMAYACGGAHVARLITEALGGPS